jgi:TRAP-type C4-dicarboxylate transport system substrate-binding protein
MTLKTVRLYSIGFAGVFLTLCGWIQTARSQEASYTLRVHHYFLESSVEHTDWLVPWARSIEEDSTGRLKVEIYPGMQLGGRATELYDQARTGIVDVAWTITGYSPGRFPRLEVFELPWVAASDAIRASAAAWDFYERYARDEFADVKLLAISTTGKGTLFMRDQEVRRPSDLSKLPIRVPSPVVAKTIQGYGALTKTLPVTELASALTKGEIAGLVTQYRIMSTLKLDPFVSHATEFIGEDALYTAVYLIVMNKARYQSLPRDLRNIIDDRSGHQLSARLGWQIDLWERDARRTVREGGAQVVDVEGDELELWKAASADRIASWIAERNAAGDDGKKLLEALRKIAEQYR